MDFGAIENPGLWPGFFIAYIYFSGWVGVATPSLCPFVAWSYVALGVDGVLEEVTSSWPTATSAFLVLLPSLTFAPGICGQSSS